MIQIEIAGLFDGAPMGYSENGQKKSVKFSQRDIPHDPRRSQEIVDISTSGTVPLIAAFS